MPIPYLCPKKMIQRIHSVFLLLAAGAMGSQFVVPYVQTPADNPARAVAALSDGGILIPDSNNHRIRKVSAGGIITTVAGTGVQGFNGDGGLATAAQLSIPFGVAPTSDSDLTAQRRTPPAPPRGRHAGCAHRP